MIFYHSTTLGVRHSTTLKILRHVFTAPINVNKKNDKLTILCHTEKSSSQSGFFLIRTFLRTFCSVDLGGFVFPNGDHKGPFSRPQFFGVYKDVILIPFSPFFV